MTEAINKAPEGAQDELEILKGRMLALETALGRLVWRCARAAASPAEWLSTYAAALERARDDWQAAKPFGPAAMRAALAALDEIRHALEEGRLSLEGRPLGPPRPWKGERSFL